MKGLIPNVRLAFFILLITMLALAANAKASSFNYPVIDDITIYPSDPGKYDDLTCHAEVSDFDGNLDYVKFNWEVNGRLVRQNNRLVYGTTDTAEDILSSWYTEPGDDVVCKVWVYDFDDYYDYDHHAVHVGEYNQNTPPSSSYVEITPRHPNPQQDLTCSVLVTDADDNLDFVNFEWFVNSERVKTSRKYVYGSSDTANDMLPSYYTEEGDYVECKITVFDGEGASDSEYSQPVYVEGVMPPYPNQKPVAILTSESTHAKTNQYIYFSGVASYDPDGYVTQYYFDFGDGSHSHWLPYSSPYAYHSYSEEGVYYVKLKVKDNHYLESDWSSEIAIHVYEDGGYGHYPEVGRVEIEPQHPDVSDNLICEAGVSDDDGNLDYVRFEWYVNDNLEESRTVNVHGYSEEVSDLLDYYNFDEGDRVKCKITVYDEEGNQESDYDIVRIGEYPYPSEQCGISIDSFDFSSFVLEGNNAWIEVGVRNTGLRSSMLTLNLFADNSLKDTHTVYLVTGREITKRFEFSLPLGVHEIRLESYLACGPPVNKYASIIVYRSGGYATLSTPYPEPPEINETSVSITPTQLDIEACKGKPIEILIESPEEANFKIEVLDLPDNWVNYPKEVRVKGRERVYAYIVPKELGEYTFRVKVTGEEKTFEKNINLYVAPQGEVSGEGWFNLTGMLTKEGNWLFGVVIAVMIAIVVVIYAGHKKFSKKTYEERIYGERKAREHPPYRQPLRAGMKGSMGNASEHSKQRAEGLNTIPAEIERYSDLSYFPKLGRDFSRR